MSKTNKVKTQKILGDSKNLSYKILAYIAYCMREVNFIFSYKSMNDVFKRYYQEDYKITTLRKEFSLLKSSGFIDYKTRYRKPIPIVSDKGKMMLKPQLPFKKFGTWDGRWRIVIFDIPEKQRADRWNLRKFLKKLAFGSLQKSVFISPYPLLGTVDKFASQLGIRQYLQLIETDKIDNENKMVEKIWKITEINNLYKNFIYEAKNINKKYRGLIIKSLEQEFLEIYERDPHLPKKFLPKNWQGQTAYQVFKTISNSY